MNNRKINKDKMADTMAAHRQWLGHVVAFGVVVVWGTTFVSSKILLNHGLDPDEIFLCRFCLAYVALLAFSHKRFMSKTWKDELLMMGLGVMGGSMYFLAENTALVFNTTSNVSILVGSSPLLTALLIGSVKHELRQTAKQFLGSLIAFAGMTLVILNGQLVLHLNPLGDMLAIGAAMTWAVYSLLMTYVGGRYSTDFITRKVFFYGIISILPVVLCKEESHITFATFANPLIVGNILFLGLAASTLGYICWNWSLSAIGTVKATNYVYIQSFITLIAAAIILGESITAMAITGVILLIGGMVLALRN